MAQTSTSTDPYSSTTDSSQSECSDPMLSSSAACQSATQQGSSGAYGQGMTGTSASQSGLGSTQNGLGQTQNYNDTSALGMQVARQQQLGERLPAQPLTEFQKFVAGTTGQMLPIFGASLFQNGPSTFAPVDQTPVPPDYVIGPGDLLRIRVWGQVNFTANVRVDRSGEIYLPQVGPVHVAGLPFQVLDQHVRQAVARVYRNFDLTADIGQIRAVQVYVVGQAHRPGTYTISSLSTLVDALFASGGPSVNGSLRHVYLKRGGQTIADFDLYDLLVKGDKSKDVKVESGDVIYIPPAGPQVALTGAVRRPGIYELRGDTNIEEILSAAGGASTVVAGSRISIDRIADHQQRQAMEVAYDPTGLSTVLEGGDVVRLLSIVPSYQKTVTLRGNTANPGRFAWHEGMHLADLIPDKDSLLTRNYWWKRAQLGLPAPEFEPVPYLTAQSQPNTSVDLRFRAQSLARKLPDCLYVDNAGSGSGAESALATNTRPCIYDPNSAKAQTAKANNSSTSDVPANSAWLNYATEPGSGQDAGTLGAISGAQPTDALGWPIDPQDHAANEGTVPEREAGLVQQKTALPGEHRTTVQLSAPEIDWSYAVIERLNKDNLKTSLIPFDLGKLVLEHDPGQNLALEPGDVVSIFSQADIHVPLAQQTKFVRLEGEFVHAGVYSVKPGETLRQLVERAGGLSPDAYLYGSQFTRESTRVIQQEHLDQYISQIQLEISRGTLAETSSAVASAQDIASANAALIAGRELISKLQQIRATGRMVLQVKPDSAGIASLPDLPLEDGDAFIVPSRPAGINVVGSVYDQNSYVFHSGSKLADYLRLAGGPNREADRKHIFLIRADGSVISRQAASSVWGNTFDATPVYPGDTVVVPEKTFGPTKLRGFLEFSQLFSQLALGAAAISVI
ncbi:SLBB domain-containing protein [Silvibacterium dinghuense]|nr:SLBB domain-containing protein [Silvibacterium dinghuense]